MRHNRLAAFAGAGGSVTSQLAYRLSRRVLEFVGATQRSTRHVPRNCIPAAVNAANFLCRNTVSRLLRRRARHPDVETLDDRPDVPRPFRALLTLAGYAALHQVQ